MDDLNIEQAFVVTDQKCSTVGRDFQHSGVLAQVYLAISILKRYLAPIATLQTPRHCV